MQYEQLVEFKRKTGHCIVPSRKYEQNLSLGIWVSTQRKTNNDNTIRLDRKERLEEIGFAWKADVTHQFKPDDKLWHEQYEKLIKFGQKNGHGMLERSYRQDMSLARWVQTQRSIRKKKKMPPYRKKLLDDIGFAWKSQVLTDPSSPVNVRGLVIVSFHTLGRSYFSLLSFFFCFLLCRIRIRKRSSPAVWVPHQTKY
jgi:hypothetical protein